jgi:G3E family GTPase
MTEQHGTDRIRFILLGGFLGAGKTTTIGRLARAYQRRGLNVGIVTNDQAPDLVDTHTLRAQGFHVGEVAGACFCCRFDELTRVVGQLTETQRPDVILCEPVGSCTDLVATVIQPLVSMYGDRFDVAPYGVILKPSHGRRILSREPRGGFSPKAAYIFQKQLEEADFLIINRVDQLTPAEVDELADLVQASQPGVPVLRLSARTGEGLEELLEFLAQQGQFGRRILELDYDIYAEGEAELGWLNSSLRVTADEPFDLDGLLLDIVRRLQVSLADAAAETAHLKTIGLWEGFHGVANLVSSDTAPELSQASDCCTRHADVVVNARVATSPESLRAMTSQAVQEACQTIGATCEELHTESFRPGRPAPTFRYDQPLTVL